MTDPVLAPSPIIQWKKSRWRWFALGALALLIPIAAGLGWIVWQRYSVDSQLQALIDDLDKNDPGWRLADIIAKRVLPDDKNAALVVIKVSATIPPGWGARLGNLRNDDLGLDKLPAPVQLNAEQVAVLRKEIVNATAAIKEADKLIDLPKGHYPIKYKPDVISTLLPNIQEAREVAHLLEMNAKLLSQDEKHEEAWKNCKVMYRVGTSLGNTELVIVMLVRLAIRSVTAAALERTLAQGQIKEESLAAAQKMLEEDQKKNCCWRRFAVSAPACTCFSPTSRTGR